MKSKIIKAVGKEIVSLLFIILSIIGVLCIGHFLYSISNMLVWIVLGILFLGYIGSVVYSFKHLNISVIFRIFVV